METTGFGERSFSAGWWPRIPGSPVRGLLCTAPTFPVPTQGFSSLPAWYVCFKRRFYYFCCDGISLLCWTVGTTPARNHDGVINTL